jgi:formylglycine-generating enzyme required for sulfatase activity/energy-coupling factor transporter ATP-binding protein EcfA2
MEKYQQWQQVERFFASFRLPDGSIQRGYNRYATPEDFRRQLNLHLRELIRRRLDTRPAAPMRPPLASVAQPQPPALWKGSPFPGLRALTPEDAPIFCGRGRETQELLHKITDAETRFVAVVGASGSGKSSLVAAGLLPALLEHTAKAPWRWARFTPGQSGAHPLRALAQALAEISAGHRTEALEERLFSGPEALTGVVADILHDDQKSAALPEAELLVFIDQFEELFTLVDPVLRSPFIHWLTAAARAPRLRIVITLRADFYAQCVEWQVLAELLRTGSYPLAAPHLGALYEMITGPAERAGLGFEAGLVAQLLQDTGTEPGALALLAFALGELYDHRSEEGRLTWDVYRAFGGVQGVIAQRADAIYHSLDADESTLGRVFGELVEVDQRGTATRRRVPLARVQRSQAASALVEALTAGRLLVRGRDEQDLPTVEVAHEALFRKWDTLQGWIESMADELRLLRQVRQAALDWSDHDRSEAYLWPHERLEPVWAAVEHLEPELDGLTREFLRPEQDRLLAELNDIATDHKRRSDIGERLAVIGDPRPGVGLREDGLPDIVWCEVPAGEVTLEDGAGSFAVPRCWIAKYPVTYLQYRSFLKAPDGFPDARVWKGLERETEAWVQNRKFANHPADNIRWFGAVAFCRWLDTRVGAEIRARFGAQYIIRLPTEWEWLQAATGGDSGNVYPWGPEWDSRRANIYESGLSRTTAVGMYPQGASPVGPLDMAGNLWEWCLNEYEAPSNTGLSGDGRRVVRGGSWDSFQDDARAAYRASNAPVSRNNSLGFR